MTKQKDKYVQGYIFSSPDDSRDGTICQVIGRCDKDGELLEQGPSFIIEFGDGGKETAACYQLQPWFPVD